MNILNSILVKDLPDEEWKEIDHFPLYRVSMQKFVSDYKELPKRELDYRLKLFVARMILQDENLYVSSHNIFGTKDDIVSSQSFAFLSILNDKYKSGLLSFTNDKVFFCNGA